MQRLRDHTVENLYTAPAHLNKINLCGHYLNVYNVLSKSFCQFTGSYIAVMASGNTVNLEQTHV